MRHEFRELRIWKEARLLNKLIYVTSEKFPKEETYGLTSQIRRASVSIASNISEGSSYPGDKMFLRYLNIALGSLCEVETQTYLALDVNYISNNELDTIIEKTDKLKRMLISFMKTLKTKKSL